MNRLDIKKFRDKYSLTQQELAEIVGSSIRAVQSWEQGQRNIPQSAIKLMGEFEKKRTVTGVAQMVPEETIGTISFLKLYDAEASGGFGTFESMVGADRVIGEFLVPSFSSADWMIHVRGSSMYPKYSSGDIIACRQIHESQFIQWNKVYVLATREQGLLIKRLMPSGKEGHFLAVSDNKDYPPFDIPNDEILGIAIVLGVIRPE